MSRITITPSCIREGFLVERLFAGIFVSLLSINTSVLYHIFQYRNTAISGFVRVSKSKAVNIELVVARLDGANTLYAMLIR